jgi:hypothetical protein
VMTNPNTFDRGESLRLTLTLSERVPEREHHEREGTCESNGHRHSLPPTPVAGI